MNFKNINKETISILESGHVYWVEYINGGEITYDPCRLYIRDKEIEFFNIETNDIIEPDNCKRICLENIIYYNKDELEKIKAKLNNGEIPIAETILARPNRYICVKTGPKSDTYTYSERKGIDSVAFIIQTGEDRYILTSERKPPMDSRINEKINGIHYNDNEEAFITTAFGGSNDKMDEIEYKKLTEEEKIEYFKNIVYSEGIEEAGYKVSKEDIKFITSAFVSTQSNQMCYLYLVDGRNAEIVEKEPDSDMEAMAIERTLRKEQILKETIDWKAKTIVA